jgi:hypothetical protein
VHDHCRARGRIAAKLSAKFNCVDLGLITWCLGIRITTSADRHTITLDLEQYLTTIVARYEFEGLQSVPTTMLHDCPTTDEAKEAMRAYPFDQPYRR